MFSRQVVLSETARSRAYLVIATKLSAGSRSCEPRLQFVNDGATSASKMQAISITSTSSSRVNPRRECLVRINCITREKSVSLPVGHVVIALVAIRAHRKQVWAVGIVRAGESIDVWISPRIGRHDRFFQVRPVPVRQPGRRRDQSGQAFLIRW